MNGPANGDAPGDASGRVDAFADLLASPSPTEDAPPPATDAGDASEEDPALRSGRRIGPYLVRGRIGRGGMGVVLRVEHAESGAEHALKLLSPPRGDDAAREMARFRREIELLARADAHPAIVRIHASGDLDGRPWYAMELIEGTPLSAQLRRGSLAPREAATLVSELARAVEHLHGLGILHRDLKPANVVVEPDGRPRLVDLGIAFEAGAERLTQTGEIIGTPAYMAPEQVKRPTDGARRRELPTVDVYGLGTILYECLGGRRPFAHLVGGMAILGALLRATRPPSVRDHAPDVPPELDAIGACALHPSSGARYRRAADLADDLDRWLRGEAVRATASAGSSSAGARARAPARRAGAAALVTVAVGVVVALAWPRRDPGPTLDPARWDALAAAALSGDPDALARASEIARLDELRRDPARARRAETIEALARLVEPGVAIAPADLDAPAIRGHHPALRDLLAAAGRVDGLARLVTRDPSLLADGPLDAPGLLLDAIEAGDLPTSPALVDALVAGVEAPRRDHDRDRRARLASRALAARLGNLIVAAEPDLAALDETMTRLLDLVRIDGATVRLSGLLVARFEEVIAEAHRTGSRLDRSKAWELVLAFRPGGGPMPPDLAARAARALAGLIVIGRLGSGPEASEQGFAAALALARHAALPMLPEEIGDFAPPEARLRATIEETLERRADGPLDIERLGSLVAAMIRVGALEIRRAGDVEDSDARSRAILAERTLLAALFDAMLDAEGRTPAWLLAWIANLIDERFARPSPASSMARDLLAEGLGRIRRAPGAPVDVLVAETIADALARDRRGPRRSQVTHFASAHTARHADEGGDPDALERALDLQLESFSIALERARFFGLRSPSELGMGSNWRVASHSMDLVRGLCAADVTHADPCRHEERLTRMAVALESILPAGHHGERARALHLWRHGEIDQGLAIIDAGIRKKNEGYPLRTFCDGAETANALGRDDDARRILSATLATDRAAQGARSLERRAALLERLGEAELAAEDRRSLRRR